MSGRERPTVMLYTYTWYTLTVMQVHTPKHRQKHTRTWISHIYVILGLESDQSIFCTIAIFCLLYGEYIVRYFLPDGVFLPCDHGPNF